MLPPSPCPNQYQLQPIFFALFASSGFASLPVFSTQKTKKPPKVPCLRAAKWESINSGSRGFHFGFIDVKVCEDLLNVLVFLQGLHQADHLLRRFPYQLDCRHWNHRQFG